MTHFSQKEESLDPYEESQADDSCYDEELDYNVDLRIVLSNFVDCSDGYRLDSEVSARILLGCPIPRYYELLFASLLIIQSSTNPLPQLSYTYYDLEVRGSNINTTSINQDEASLEPPKKRPKKAAARSPKPTAPPSISIGVPSSLVLSYNLQTKLKSLNDTLLPTSSLIGYIVTLLGGVLHISYPPTIEELTLYCHVVYLHRRLDTLGREVEDTLTGVLSGLSRYDDFGALPSQTVLDLARVVWLDCSRDEQLLELVTGLLDQKLLVSFLNFVYPIQPNAAAYVSMAKSVFDRPLSEAVPEVTRSAFRMDPFSSSLDRLLPTSAVSKADIAPTAGKKTTAKKASAKRGSTAKKSTAAASTTDDAAALLDATESSYLVHFKSSIPGDATSVPLVHTLHAAICALQWPTLLLQPIVSLPLSDSCILIILQAMYAAFTNDLTDYKPFSTLEGPKAAIRLLSDGKELGLFSKLSTKGLQPPYKVTVVSELVWAKDLLPLAWSCLFTPETYDLNASTWWQPLAWAHAFGLPNMAEAELKRIKTRGPIYKKDISSLVPELQARIETND